MFDIVTQYRAIFSDEVSTDETNEDGLLCGWMNEIVSDFLTTLDMFSFLFHLLILVICLKSLKGFLWRIFWISVCITDCLWVEWELTFEGCWFPFSQRRFTLSSLPLFLLPLLTSPTSWDLLHFHHRLNSRLILISVSYTSFVLKHRRWRPTESSVGFIGFLTNCDFSQRISFRAQRTSSLCAFSSSRDFRTANEWFFCVCCFHSPKSPEGVAKENDRRRSRNLFSALQSCGWESFATHHKMFWTNLSFPPASWHFEGVGDFGNSLRERESFVFPWLGSWVGWTKWQTRLAEADKRRKRIKTQRKEQEEFIGWNVLLLVTVCWELDPNDWQNPRSVQCRPSSLCTLSNDEPSMPIRCPCQWRQFHFSPKQNWMEQSYCQWRSLPTANRSIKFFMFCMFSKMNELSPFMNGSFPPNSTKLAKFCKIFAMRVKVRPVVFSGCSHLSIVHLTLPLLNPKSLGPSNAGPQKRKKIKPEIAV